MVIWNETIIGHYNMTQIFKGETTEYKIDIHSGNCLGVEIYEFKDENGADKVQLLGFWNDEQHLKNMLGLSKEYKGENCYKTEKCNVTEIWLNTKYEQVYKIAKLFAKTKIKVILEYKEEEGGAK